MSTRRGTARGRGQGVTPMVAASVQNSVVDEIESDEGEGGSAPDAVPTPPSEIQQATSVPSVGPLSQRDGGAEAPTPERESTESDAARSTNTQALPNFSLFEEPNPSVEQTSPPLVQQAPPPAVLPLPTMAVPPSALYSPVVLAASSTNASLPVAPLAQVPIPQQLDVQAILNAIIPGLTGLIQQELSGAVRHMDQLIHTHTKQVEHNFAQQNTRLNNLVQDQNNTQQTLSRITLALQQTTDALHKSTSAQAAMEAKLLKIDQKVNAPPMMYAPQNVVPMSQVSAPPPSAPLIRVPGVPSTSFPHNHVPGVPSTSLPTNHAQGVSAPPFPPQITTFSDVPLSVSRPPPALPQAQPPLARVPTRPYIHVPNAQPAERKPDIASHKRPHNGDPPMEDARGVDQAEDVFANDDSILSLCAFLRANTQVPRTKKLAKSFLRTFHDHVEAAIECTKQDCCYDAWKNLCHVLLNLDYDFNTSVFKMDNNRYPTTFGLHPDLAQILCLELQTMLETRNVEAETGNSDTTFSQQEQQEEQFKKVKKSKKTTSRIISDDSGDTKLTFPNTNTPPDAYPFAATPAPLYSSIATETPFLAFLPGNPLPEPERVTLRTDLAACKSKNIPVIYLSAKHPSDQITTVTLNSLRVPLFDCSPISFPAFILDLYHVANGHANPNPYKIALADNATMCALLDKSITMITVQPTPPFKTYYLKMRGQGAFQGSTCNFNLTIAYLMHFLFFSSNKSANMITLYQLKQQPDQTVEQFRLQVEHTAATTGFENESLSTIYLSGLLAPIRLNIETQISSFPASTVWSLDQLQTMAMAREKELSQHFPSLPAQPTVQQFSQPPTVQQFIPQQPTIQQPTVQQYQPQPPVQQFHQYPPQTLQYQPQSQYGPAQPFSANHFQIGVGQPNSTPSTLQTNPPLSEIDKLTSLVASMVTMQSQQASNSANKRGAYGGEPRCPHCHSKAHFTKEECQFKEMPIVCYFCKGPHKMPECNDPKKKPQRSQQQPQQPQQQQQQQWYQQQPPQQQYQYQPPSQPYQPYYLPQQPLGPPPLQQPPPPQQQLPPQQQQLAPPQPQQQQAPPQQQLAPPQQPQQAQAQAAPSTPQRQPPGQRD